MGHAIMFQCTHLFICGGDRTKLDTSSSHTMQYSLASSLALWTALAYQWSILGAFTKNTSQLLIPFSTDNVDRPRTDALQHAPSATQLPPTPWPSLHLELYLLHQTPIITTDIPRLLLAL